MRVTKTEYVSHENDQELTGQSELQENSCVVGVNHSYITVQSACLDMFWQPRSALETLALRDSQLCATVTGGRDAGVKF